MTSDNAKKTLLEIFIIECKNCKTETEHVHLGQLIPKNDRKNNAYYFDEDILNKDMYACRKCKTSLTYDKRTLERKETSLVYDPINLEVKKKE